MLGSTTSMRLARGLRRCHSAISSFAGRSHAGPAPAAQAQAEPVRDAMRGLADELAGGGSARLRYAIDTARDVAGVWHLRITLMQALAVSFGEGVARARIAALDPLFVQAWPEAPILRA